VLFEPDLEVMIFGGKTQADETTKDAKGKKVKI